jgi:hypothetical protein
MSWNGSGTYTLPPATTPEVAGTIIDASRYNATLSDMAAGITAALARNGENAPTANLPMGGFKHTGAVAGVAPGQYLVYGQTNPFLSPTCVIEGAQPSLSYATAAGAERFLLLNNTSNAAGAIHSYAFSVAGATAASLTCFGKGTGLGEIAFATSAVAGTLVERMRVFNTGQFTVAIGTGSPVYATANRGLMEVNGTSDSLFGLTVGGVASGFLQALAGSLTLGTSGTLPLRLLTNGTVQISIDGTTGAVAHTSATLTLAGSQVATQAYVGANFAPKANPAFTGTVDLGTSAIISGVQVGYRDMVPAGITSGSLAVTHVGQCVYASGAITVPNAIFSQGHTVSIYNNTGGAIAINAGITTLRLGGSASTGTRSLAARGLALILFISSNEAVVFGTGVS